MPILEKCNNVNIGQSLVETVAWKIYTRLPDLTHGGIIGNYYLNVFLLQLST